MNEVVCYADAAELASCIRTKALSPVEVVRAHLERIEALNPGLNAVVTVADGAMERARQAEASIMRGEPLGPLHGVPFTAKDCFDTNGLRTTRGSRLFSDHVPDADATAVKRLADAGGILIGKTNTPEFAFWWETDNLVFGRTENPWRQGRTPGGSSGGEASAIAAGLSPLGLGSDVGGSIREPAAYCGIVGLKPTYGRVSLTGHFPDVLASLFHVGPMARSVRDAALALSVLAGPDGEDPNALPVAAPEIPDLDEALPELRVGWCAEGPFAPVAEEVQATVTRAASALDELGCKVEEVGLATWEQWPAQEISTAIYTADVRHHVERVVGDRLDQLSPVLQRRLDLPPPPLGEYLEAWADVQLFREEVARFFSNYDLLLCPTCPTVAHPHDSAQLEIDGQKVPPRNALRATVPFDLTGSPAVSVPFGWGDEDLPIGVQLVGRHFDESTVLHAASALEALRDHRHRRPPI